MKNKSTVIVQMHKARHNQLTLLHVNYVNCFNIYYIRGTHYNTKPFQPIQGTPAENIPGTPSGTWHSLPMEIFIIMVWIQKEKTKWFFGASLTLVHA